MSGPDRIWAWSRLEWKTDSGTWSDCELPRSTEYIRRDPAVLAALPEVQALTAAIKTRALAAEAAALERAGKLEGGLPADFQALLADAMAEASRAMVKFPQPNYVISKFAEESGEVVKAAIHHAEGRKTRDAVVGEMCQALAMMLRLWIEGDQVHGMAPLCASAARVKGGAE